MEFGKYFFLYNLPLLAPKCRRHCFPHWKHSRWQLTVKYFRWIFNLAWISISRSQSSWKGPREHCVIVLTRPAKPELLSGKFSCLSCDFRSPLLQSHFSFRNSSGVVLPVTIHLNVETQDVEAFCDFYFLRCCVWLVFSFLRVFFDE